MFLSSGNDKNDVSSRSRVVILEILFVVPLTARPPSAEYIEISDSYDAKGALNVIMMSPKLLEMNTAPRRI